MPTAALADIHGNRPALEAVLADPRLLAADRIVVLGDVVTGTVPAETLDRLTAMPGRVLFLRGNADRLALDDPAEWYGWVRDRLGPERLDTVAAGR
jgi:predicted phosphodiesterase